MPETLYSLTLEKPYSATINFFRPELDHLSVAHDGVSGTGANQCRKHFTRLRSKSLIPAYN